MRIPELFLETYLNQLDELTRPDTMGKAEKVLEKAGYVQLGTGAFASVYVRPGSSNVLKLFYADDTAYIDFVKATLKYPNPHFPKFKGKMMKITDTYYAVQMEKLREYNGSWKNPSLLSSYIYYLQGLHDADIADEINALEKEQPGIKAACKIIADKVGHHLDLASNNLMMRGNTIVITDPVV